MKYAVLSLIICLSIQAGSDIKGAFNIKLGSTIKPKEGTPQISLIRLKFYTFVPKKKMAGFEKYALAVTPKSKKVCAIVIIANLIDNAAAEAKKSELAAILEKKYGTRDEAGDDMYNAIIIKKGTRQIYLRVVKSQLRVYYKDTALIETALGEARQIERDKLNED